MTLAWDGGECTLATISWGWSKYSLQLGIGGWNPRLAASSFCEQPGEGVCAGVYHLMPMGINLFTTLGVCAIGG